MTKITHKSVRELIQKFESIKICEENELIDNWIREHQPEQSIVGLTDKQIKDLSLYIYGHTNHNADYQWLISAYLEKQKFALPEVKEVPVGLSDKQVEALVNCEWLDISCSAGSVKRWLKTQTFAQPEPMVVGLSDAQIKQLSNYLCANVDQNWNRAIYEEELTNWFKSQNFIIHTTEVVGLTDQQISDLSLYVYHRANSTADYQWLISSYLSTQKFTLPEVTEFQPTWDDAPEWANWVAQNLNGSWVFFEEEPENYSCTNRWIVNSGNYHVVTINRNWKQTLQQRPKPVPKVEVGQVWRNIETEAKYQIDSIGKSRDSGVWVECVTYRSLVDGCFYTRALDDFLAKFEKVQS